MPHAALRRSVRDLARAEDAVLADYGAARGSPACAASSSRRAADDGIDAGPDHVLLTASGTQALDLVCRALLRPGDTVLLDDPCYFNFQRPAAGPWRAVGRRALSRRPAPIPPASPRSLAAQRPRLYVTNSALHNPTGATLSPQAAHRLLNAAAAHDLAIVEDDTFADLEPEPSPRLAALDGLDRVIRIGSFSKTLSASIRCGYVVARPTGSKPWSTSRSPPASAARAPWRRSWSARTWATAAIAGTSKRCGAACRGRGARRRPGWRTSASGPGWCRAAASRCGAACRTAATPPRSPARRSATAMVLAPGDVFSPSHAASDFMRFNVAQMDDPRVYEVLGRALRA